MKNIMRTLLVVMVLALVLAVFAACNLSTPDPKPTTQPECEHTGGTATCEDAAVCEKCGKSYGEKLEHTIVTREGREANVPGSGSKVLPGIIGISSLAPAGFYRG